MKFSKKEIKDYLQELSKIGWITDDFKQNNDFLNDCIKLDFTSPDKKDVFNAFKLFKPNETQILILGQDPYPEDEYREKHYGKRAHGLAFSFQNEKGINEPADDSLLNIFKAIVKYKKTKQSDDIYNWNTNLSEWAKTNKVLLLNTALSHESKDEEKITKHRKVWKPFVDEVIKKLIASDNKTAIFLWGKKAQETFFKAFNESDIKKDNIEINITKPDKEDDIKYRRSKSLKVKTSIELIRGTIELGNKRIYLTSHPSDLGVNDGFADDAPNHFEACDKFLFEKDESKYIWKNFPEQ